MDAHFIGDNTVMVRTADVFGKLTDTPMPFEYVIVGVVLSDDGKELIFSYGREYGENP